MIDWRQAPLVGRDSQVQAIREALASPQARCILIHGLSGTGKSFLALRTLQRKAYGHGKYDQFTQFPYSAIETALHGFVRQCAPSTLESAARLFAPPEVALLCSVFGFLSRSFPGQNGPTEERMHTEAAMLRFHRLVRRLIGALGTSALPCILFLDDLQWADDNSRRLLNAILTDKNMKNFVLMGAVRDGEDTTFVPPVDSMPMTRVTADALESNDIANLLTQVLGQSKEIERFTNLLCAKTKGNPYFVRQYVELLIRKGSVQTFDGGFICDPDTLEDRSERSKDVVDLLIDKIYTAEPVTQLILILSSALGHTIRKDVLAAFLDCTELVCGFPEMLRISFKVLMQVNQDSMEHGLEDAEKNELISIVDENRFVFTHDRVQQAACQLLPTGKQRDYVFATMGSIILDMSRCERDSDNWLLFTATRLLFQHGSALRVSNRKVATLCLQSAVAAASNTAYKEAAYFADAGIEMLGPNPWNKKTYRMCVDLYSLSAEAHRCALHTVKTKARVKSIQRHAATHEDKFRGYNVLIDMLLQEKKFDEAALEARSGLETLGITLPRTIGIVKAVRVSMDVQTLLKGRRVKDLLKLPLLKQSKYTEAIHLFAAYTSACFYTGRNMSVATGCATSLKTTLQHGIGPLAAMSFAMYGVGLANEGKFQQAYRFCKTAVSGGFPVPQERQSYVMVGYCAFAAHIVHPLHETLDWTDRAYEVGMSNGELTDACQALYLRSQLGIFLRPSLPELSR